MEKKPTNIISLEDYWRLLIIGVPIGTFILNAGLHLSIQLRGYEVKFKTYFLSSVVLTLLIYILVVLSPGYFDFFFILWGLCVVIYIMFLKRLYNLHLNKLVFLAPVLAMTSFVFGFGGEEFKLFAVVFVWSNSISSIFPFSIKEKQLS
jgi:hypothetical protein